MDSSAENGRIGNTHRSRRRLHHAPPEYIEQQRSSTSTLAHPPRAISHGANPYHQISRGSSAETLGLDRALVLPTNFKFLRIDVETDVQKLGELFNKLHIKDEKRFHLHIHCIDYCIDHDDCKDNCNENADVKLGDNVKKDLSKMLDTTVGIVFTWSGLRNSTVHAALEGVNLEKLLSVATPFWSDVRETMKTQLEGYMENGPQSKHVEETLGDEISPCANQFLLLDCVAPQSESPEEKQRRKTYYLRHFHENMIEAMESDSKEVPVVCVLFHGGEDALNTVYFALEKQIPVLVVKGSGGYADLIAKIYEETELKTKKERLETGEIHTRRRKVPSTKQRLKHLIDNKLLSKVCSHLDMITVYIPGSSLISLDSVIFEAVLKHNQPETLTSPVRPIKFMKDTSYQSRAYPVFNAKQGEHIQPTSARSAPGRYLYTEPVLHGSTGLTSKQGENMQPTYPWSSPEQYLYTDPVKVGSMGLTLKQGEDIQPTYPRSAPERYLYTDPVKVGSMDLTLKQGEDIQPTYPRSAPERYLSTEPVKVGSMGLTLKQGEDIQPTYPRSAPERYLYTDPVKVGSMDLTLKQGEDIQPTYPRSAPERYLSTEPVKVGSMGLTSKQGEDIQPTSPRSSPERYLYTDPVKVESMGLTCGWRNRLSSLESPSIIREDLHAYADSEPEQLNSRRIILQDMESTTSQTSEDQTALFEKQMDYFISALTVNNAQEVRGLLTDLGLADKFMEHFHKGRVLQLYNYQNKNKWKTMKNIRDNLEKLLERLSYFPLRCHVKDCLNCNTDTNPASDESKHERTCLHPMQELFLWSLYKESLDLALVFWERCNDKIVAALFAGTVFRLHAEKKDPEEKSEMIKAAKQFQTLAIDTLKSCHQIDVKRTESLLTKPCSWWGDVSVLQMAIMGRNREFLEQTACRNVMGHIWKGKPPMYSDPVTGENKRQPCQFVDSDETGKDCNSCRPKTRRSKHIVKCMNLVQSPRFKYGLSFFSQVAFLVFFSGVLLFDLHHGITYSFGILSGWVLAICVEEVRQFVFRDPVLKNNSTAKRRSFRVYFHLWNFLDMCTIIFFALGFMLIAIPSNPMDHKQLIFAGRIILCIDFIFFCMRFLQMLVMLHAELGLMVIMVFEMVGDTWRFFVILMICVLSYAVTSESLLYEENEMSLPRFYNVPRKAYWQVFGELSLEEIENNDDTCASGNNSRHYGNDVPHCPSEYGSKVVPFLLGAYILLTNVLLINLLIARFGVTFSNLLGKAGTIQVWQRCQITVEYYGRPILPPPLNLISIIFEIFSFFLGNTQRCSCRKCCQADGHEQHGNGEGTELIPRVSTVRAADGQSMDIFWCNTLKIPNGNSYYTVKLWKIDAGMISQSEQVTYTVAQKPLSDPHCPSKQALTVWDLDPCYRYTVEVEDKTASDADQEEERRTSLSVSEAYQGILDFENNEMRWALQKQASDRIFADLPKMMDSTKAEVRELKADIRNELNCLPKMMDSTKVEVRELKANISYELNRQLTKHQKKNKQIQDVVRQQQELQQQQQQQHLTERQNQQLIQELLQKQNKQIQDLLKQLQELQHRQQLHQLIEQRNQQLIHELLQKQQKQIQDLLQQQQELLQQQQLQQL